MYKCRHFAIHELVPPSLYQSHGEKAWKYLDEGLLRDIDTIRDAVYARTGQTIIINSYKWGGGYTESGLRTPDCDHYNPLSGHTFGKAVDLKLSGWFEGNPDHNRDWLQDVIRELKEDGILVSITEMELGTDTSEIPWCHLGSRNVAPIGDAVLYEFYG